MSAPLIFPGTSCKELGSKIAKNGGIKLGLITKKNFHDGELYLRIESDVSNKHCIVVQSISYPQDSNFMELITIIDTLKDIGASRVTAVVPYFGYGRQDKRFKPGEAISSKIIAKHLSLDIDEFITVNIHEDKILDFFDKPAFNLDSSHLLGDYFKTRDVTSPIIVSPDRGALKIATDVSKVIKCPFDYLEKTRLGPGKVQIKPKNLEVKDRDVIIVDDMIDSGNTMIEAIKLLNKQGPGDIYVGCIHPVFNNNVISKFLSLGVTDVVSTDTISSPKSLITVSSLITEALRRL